MANEINNTQDVNKSKIDANAIVQAGLGGAGALSTAYSIYGNIKNRDDINSRVNSLYSAPFRGTDTFDSLGQEFLNYTPYRNFTMEDMGFNSGAAAMNVLSSSMQGAGAGAAFGGWGALIGGVAGLGAGLFGYGAARNKAKKMLNYGNTKIQQVNDYNLNALDNRLSNAQREQFGSLKLNSGYALRGAYGGPLGLINGPIDYSMAMQYLDMKNSETQNKLMADGGQLHTHGADWNTGLNYVGNGGSHEENPYDGVPMGIAPDGQPNLVEEGEVIWNNDYVFSKRLKVPKAVRRKYKLGGLKPLSFADAVMKVNKDVEERPNDPIALRGRDAILGALAEVQDMQRAKKEAKQAQQEAALMQEMQPIQPMVAANGGLIGHKFAESGWLNNFTNWLNNKRYFDTEAARAVSDRYDALHPQVLYDIPYLSQASLWDRDLNYTEDGKNLSKDAMNWFAQQAKRIGGSDYTVSGPVKNNAFLNDYNAFIGGLDSSLFTGTLSDRVENILAKANKGPAGNVSKGIQRLYDTYGKTKDDARRFLYLDLPTPKILPQTLLNPAELANPANRPAILNGAAQMNQRIQNMSTTGAGDTDNNKTDWVSRLRYIPAIGAGIGVLGDLFGWTNKPDYSQADAIARAARGIGTVSASPIGDYLQYRPMDRMFALNMLNANAGANRRAILNTTAGNRGTAMAGLLASDNNTLNNIGNLWRQAEEYNAQQLEKSKTFNKATNMFNSELDLKAQQANLGRDEVVMRGLQAAAAMRDTIDQRVGAAKSANLTNLFQSLGDIGWEAFNRNMINTNRALYYGIDSDGHVKYKDAFYALPKEMQDVVRERAEIDRKTRALGGRINKRRR